MVSQLKVNSTIATCLQMMQRLLVCSQKMKHDVVHTQVSFLVVKYGNNSTLFHLEAAAVDGLLPAYHSFVLSVLLPGVVRCPSIEQVQ